MEALDPQLRSQQKPLEPYSDVYRYPPPQNAQSPYTLNPIRRLPPPQQQSSTLPSISQDPNLPYYSAKQPELPPSEETLDIAISSPNQKGDGQDAQKRPRSCESCRALKVRCERDPSMTGPCKRCAKADRSCIFTEPSHKRKKKADNKVAELEKKIDALTASLVAVQGNNAKLGEDEDELDENSLEPHDPMLSDAKPSRKRRRSTFERGQDLSSSSHLGHSAKQLAAASLNHALAAPLPLENSFQNHEYADVIDRQVLSSAVAAEMFNYYREHMAPYLPAVVIPPCTTVGDIRRERPILFLAILSVASGHKHSNIQRTLLREIMQTYADRVVNKGEKSLELIQAMHISTTWHFAEDQNDTRPFQLSQMAAAMGVAIKFIHENHPTPLGFGLGRNASRLPSEKKELMVERKRALLGCFLLSGISSTNLKQQNTVHWSRFMDEAVKVLENAEDAASTDIILCRMAKLQRIYDQAIGLFFKEGTAIDISRALTDLEKQTQLNGPDIEASGSYSLRFMYKFLLIYFSSLQVMITSLGESNGSVPPTAESKQDFLYRYGEPMSDTALTAVMPSPEPMQDALEIFLSIPQDHLDALPSLWFTRLTYLIIFLMFLNLRVTGSARKQNNPGELASMPVGEYLNRIMEKLQASNHDDHNPAVQKFEMVLRIFKSWYERQRDGPKVRLLKREGPDPSQLPAEPIDSERNTPRLGYRKLSVHSETNSDGKPASKSPAIHPKPDTLAPPSHPKASAPTPQIGGTPLGILSEVASNEPVGSAQQQQQQQPQSRASRLQHQQPHQAPPPQEGWYNQLNSYASQPYVTETQPYYPNQHDFANVSGYGMDGPYQHTIDPELEHAMCSAFGSEGNMMGTYFHDCFSMGQAQNGMPYGNWYSNPEQ